MEFRILGPVEAWEDNIEVPLEGSKQRTVLAALLLARGRMISDALLTARLWGDEPPNTSPAQLYTYVSRLRRHLSGAVDIVRRRPGYVLHTGSAYFDYEEFERLTRAGQEELQDGYFERASHDLRGAGELWRGPPLANVTDQMASAELPKMEEARMLALESRIEADLALGRHGALVVELTGLVNEHPLRERLRAQYMLALYHGDRQAEAFSAYQRGRDVLVAELGVDPGPALRDAYHAILDGARAPIVPLLTVGRPIVVVHQVTPAMLPVDTGDFAGRTAELARIGSCLSAPERNQLLITGMAGVGKTALAIHAAHRHRNRYPDGQLYVDLGGSAPAGAGPVEPDDVLGWFLKALGTPAAALPDELEERAQLYRSWLADKRVLVVLDNCVSDQQIRPLLPGGSRCGVIITARATLTALNGPEIIDLGPPSRVEGVEMLAKIVGADRVAAEPECAERIVDLCGDLPLPVRVIGLRLAAAREMPLWALLDRLAVDQCRLDELRLGDLDVRASLMCSYERLSGPARVALRRLALPTVPELPDSVVATILEVPGRLDREVVEELVAERLLETVRAADQAGEPHYRFHPLVRLFGYELAQVEDSPQARRMTLDRALAAWLGRTSPDPAPASRRGRPEPLVSMVGPVLVLLGQIADSMRRPPAKDLDARAVPDHTDPLRHLGQDAGIH